MPTGSKLITEFVGTFIFLSVIALSEPLGALAPLAIGAGLMVMVYMGAHVSGGHYNPAVSFGVFLRRKLSAQDMVAYWVVQLLGAVLAFVFGSAATPRAFIPGPGSKSYRRFRWRSYSLRRWSWLFSMWR